MKCTLVQQEDTENLISKKILLSSVSLDAFPQGNIFFYKDNKQTEK